MSRRAGSLAVMFVIPRCFSVGPGSVSLLKLCVTYFQTAKMRQTRKTAGVIVLMECAAVDVACRSVGFVMDWWTATMELMNPERCHFMIRHVYSFATGPSV